MQGTTDNNYDLVSRFYDRAAHVYSGGQIRACKEAQMPEIKPGDRILYAGAGGGLDAALAARAGAEVTVIDLSAGMLERARETFRAHDVSQQIEVIEGDVFEHTRPGHYDAVAANFFLNVFSEETMHRMLQHLLEQLRPGGKLMVADFTPLSDAPVQRSVQRLYFGIACTAFRVLAANAMHPIYDYRENFARLPLKLEGVRDFPLFGLGPRWYRTLVATRES